LLPSGPTERAVDSAGHPRAIFKRAIERGNVVVAEATARELGLSLEEALQLVLLYAAYEPAKVERAALRWFSRYLVEGKGVTLLKAQVALAALGELRAGTDAAWRLLVELAGDRFRAGSTCIACRVKPGNSSFGHSPVADCFYIAPRSKKTTHEFVINKFFAGGFSVQLTFVRR
jgi:hypothetical protein